MRKKGDFSVITSDIEGNDYGKLHVKCLESEIYENTTGGEKHRYYYRCICECGCQKVVRRESLILGLSKSCGCSRRKHKN